MGIGSSKAKKEKPTTNNADKVTSKDMAVLDLKRARDKLNKFTKQIENENKKIDIQVRELVKTQNKSRALLLLKMKKMKEKQIEDVSNQLLTIFNMIDKIEWETINIKAMNALKDGTAALNALHSEMSPEDIELLLEESEEAREMENQISNLLMGKVAAEEEDELNAELELLMSSMSVTAGSAATQDVKKASTIAVTQTQVVLDLPAVPTETILPEVPTAPIKVNSNEEKLSEKAVEETRQPTAAVSS